VRACPVCETPAANAPVFLNERVDRSQLTAYSFAARKVPEFMNHRLVRCTTCDLVYVAEPPAQAELAQAYHVAAYDSAVEANDAAATYLAALGPAVRALPHGGAVLEIGTGTGILLEKLAARGFATLVGIEPSAAAIAAASPVARAWIREGVFDEADFAPQSFDLICCFMTMEHVFDPGVVAHAAYRLLRPGGVFATVTHDYRGFVNRILGKRSPIIDVEHMQLFSRASIRQLFERAGFRNVSVSALRNSYALEYWLRLSPLPAPVNAALRAALAKSGLGGRKLSLDVGNILCAGVK